MGLLSVVDQTVGSRVQEFRLPPGIEAGDIEYEFRDFLSICGRQFEFSLGPGIDEGIDVVTIPYARVPTQRQEEFGTHLVRFQVSNIQHPDTSGVTIHGK